ncbi:MAG: hypothetical protein GY792_10405 [Gammaproteobacteria bacterium]|nr:hypothetical protein [Gammaproteobacteria bacterium]
MLTPSGIVHRSLTESPIENARDLANWLTTFPQDITVDLVSYSRGGRRRITFDDPPGWWDRIQILAGDPVSDFVAIRSSAAGRAHESLLQYWAIWNLSPPWRAVRRPKRVWQQLPASTC